MKITLRFTAARLVGYLGIGILLVGGGILLLGFYEGVQSMAWQMSRQLPMESIQTIGIGTAVGAIGAGLTWWSLGRQSRVDPVATDQ